MQRAQQVISAIFYSFPVQLVQRQLRRHKIMLLFWLFLLGAVSGSVGRTFGGPFLFLEPEYLGQENFWSVFIVGSALGAFLFAYTITLYIHESYRFHFVALCKSPFYALAFNNFIIPGTFLSLYFYNFISYHAETAGGFTWAVFEKTMGLAFGIGLVFLISASYFFANRTLIHRFGRKLEDSLQPKKAGRRRWVILGKARESMREPQRTDSYLDFPMRIIKVNAPQGSQLRQIIRSLNQHHGKLLLLQVMMFLFFAGLSLLEENRLFQIPAGASFLLIASLAIMSMGAISFWFRKSGLLTLATIGLLMYVYGNSPLFTASSQAIGMNYSVQPADYSHERLAQLNQPGYYESDRDHTLASLEAWKARYQARYGVAQKPRAILVCASGGGLRSAFWTFRVMQQLDSLSEGEVFEELRLMSGASGGMFGLSYYRELAWRRAKGMPIALHEAAYYDNISKDLLNRIFFRKFSDLLLPSQEIMVDEHVYNRERGFSFDDQLVRNLPEFQGRRIKDYAEPEAAGEIPVMILEPTLINQGRKLYISASPVSFLTHPHAITNHYFSRSSGVEFQRFFVDQGADNLYLSSALRMNATFPYILPVVELPSEPVMQVMDAGAIDNYGTQTALKYLFEFREWFENNTEQVILVQIRDHTREDPIQRPVSSGILQRLLAPIGAGYYSVFEAKDMSNDYLLEYVRAWYREPVEVVSFTYASPSPKERASLSWHLTQREKQSIEGALQAPANQQSFQHLQSMYPPQLLAKRISAKE